MFPVAHKGWHAPARQLYFFCLFPEHNLTPETLSKILDHMSDHLWRTFGEYINTPKSELKRIEQECTSDKECKEALIHSFISSHPAPSWPLVAQALYMTDKERDDESCLKAFNLLQQLFPTGMCIIIQSFTSSLLICNSGWGCIIQ